MSRHALEVLEFGRALELVAARAASELARERIRSLTPSSEPTAVRAELARVGVVMRFCDARPGWGMPAVPDVREALRQLAAEGALLEPLDLHGLGVLLGSSRALGAELDSWDERPAEIAALRALLIEDRPSEEVLERSVDAEGKVLDTASKELRRIRDRLTGAHSRLVRQLEAYMRTLPERLVVPDASVTVREGRYVIPIRREGRADVGGIVHDASQSGSTLFVEPPIAIELMNELRDLEREEAREVRRILGELSARLAPSRSALTGALDALVDFDTLHARARTALGWRASVPVMVDGDEPSFGFVRARHPLLVSGGRPVVPYDLDVLPGERALVVSGPNTGGKSVFLKATGLIAALAQSGIVPPVGPGTRLPVFSSIFADIGDEQSISESLSTFSAHLANLSAIVREADARSLVLIDEMGTGTDPAEGAALARAVLEELVVRGAFTIASSHLGELKRLDAEGGGIVNASLQFDPDRMEPTYELVKGRPGRSYGLAIARRLGFPAPVLDRAEGHLEKGEVRLEDLLERLERQDREAAEHLQALEDERAAAARLREGVAARERVLREAERTADRRASEEARRVLLEARAEVDGAIAEVRAAAEAGADIEEAAKRARRRVEQAASRSVARQAAAVKDVPSPELATGTEVRVHATGAKGTVMEVRDRRAVVEVGAMRMEVPISDLDPVAAAEPGTVRQRRGGWSGPSSDQVRTEVDLRGLRVDELERELFRALDQAILEDLPELRVIHGKGTGALRQRVAELLAGDARVLGYRMGGLREGGAGVTVASFR